MASAPPRDWGRRAPPARRSIGEDPAIREQAQHPGRASQEVPGIGRLVHDADVPRQDAAALCGRARDRVRERQHAGEALAAELLETAGDKPALAVPRDRVEQHQPAQLDGVARGAGEDAGEDLVVGRVAEDGHPNQLAQAEQPEAPPRGGVAARVVVGDDEALSE